MGLRPGWINNSVALRLLTLTPQQNGNRRECDYTRHTHPLRNVPFFSFDLKIAYGILRTQLFDIDLRIRWTIKQSTLAAAVVSIIFVLSEGAERLLSSTLGDFTGLWAAGIVVFFLAPLQCRKAVSRQRSARCLSGFAIRLAYHLPMPTLWSANCKNTLPALPPSSPRGNGVSNGECGKR
jgi:hypothetical protein